MMRVTLLVAAVTTICVAGACGSGSTPQARDTVPAAAHGGVASAVRTEPLEDLGQYHRAIQTRDSLAQAFFDEGLTLLYGFNHEEAHRSFARAASLDPRAPMPHWGMALSLGTNINDPAPAERIAKAARHLRDAQQRLAAGSAVERGLVTALARRYAGDSVGEQVVREAAYANAMGALAREFPDDADVATLHAESLMNLHPWRLYRADGSPEAWTPAIVATLERVLAAHPVHPGANHYYVHAVEASSRPERAMASATRLETLVPGAGHLVHMPSHIYIRTGQYEKAARSNAIAAAVDEKYVARTGTTNFYAMSYFSHNLQFETAAAMFSGNVAEARQSARRTTRLTDPMADGMAMLEPFAAMELLVQARFGDWSAILATAPPPPTRVLQSGLHRWARGIALAGTGRAGDAATQLDSLRRLHARVPKDAMVGPVNWGGDVLAVAIADLQGHIAQARRDDAGALAAFTRAVAAEDRLGYNEPPDWLFPERERLGAALLAAGRAKEAVTVFREELGKHPGNPWALHGLRVSLDVLRDTSASRVKRQFDEAWKGGAMLPGVDLYPRRP